MFGAVGVLLILPNLFLPLHFRLAVAAVVPSIFIICLWSDLSVTALMIVTRIRLGKVALLFSQGEVKGRPVDLSHPLARFKLSTTLQQTLTLNLPLLQLP